MEDNERPNLEDNKYPNLDPPKAGMGDLKSIAKLPKPVRLPPQIAWGEEYKSWPIEKRLDYAEKLASSMNHAADLLQEERNRLLEIATQQEIKLKAYAKSHLEQGNLVQRELAAADVEKQQLYQEIVQLKAQVKNLQSQVTELKRELHRS